MITQDTHHIIISSTEARACFVTMDAHITQWLPPHYEMPNPSHFAELIEKVSLNFVENLYSLR